MLVFMFAGSQLKEESEFTQEEMNNLTDRISYDNLNVSKLSRLGNDQNETFISRLIYKYADFLMFAGVEGAKVGFNMGYNNPQYNFGLMWKLMFVSIFAFCIIPLIYLLLFIGYGIYNIVNWIKNKLVKKSN